MEDNTYHVKLSDGKWIATREGNGRISVCTDIKEDTVQLTREIATVRKSRVLVYDDHGNLQPERTYPRVYNRPQRISTKAV